MYLYAHVQGLRIRAGRPIHEERTSQSKCKIFVGSPQNYPKIADIKRIEKIPSVKGTFTQAGQFQVIIAPGSAIVYLYLYAHVQGLRIRAGRSIHEERTSQIICTGGLDRNCIL